MDLSLSDEQRALADSARAFLSREWATGTVRELEDEPTGFRPSLWKRKTMSTRCTSARSSPQTWCLCLLK